MLIQNKIKLKIKRSSYIGSLIVGEKRNRPTSVNENFAHFDVRILPTFDMRILLRALGYL